MTDKTREKTLEEQIAEGLYTRMNPASKFLSWDELDVGGKAREVWETEAKVILAIPEIKEGQELREKAESGKLVELDEDQRASIYDGHGEVLESAWDDLYHDPDNMVRRVKPLSSGESR